jgi:Stress responsive A/B Barrel Domain
MENTYAALRLEEKSMYIHMFAFRWKPGVTEGQKQRAKDEILALQGQIPGLLETYAGTNVSPRGSGYEFGGVMKFTDKAALDAYTPHPIHQKLLDWLVPLVEPVEVDFHV